MRATVIYVASYRRWRRGSDLLPVHLHSRWHLMRAINMVDTSTSQYRCHDGYPHKAIRVLDYLECIFCLARFDPATKTIIANRA